MRVLFVCNTYMQVIVAIQMKQKLYRDDDVDIIISDHSQGSQQIVSGIEKIGLFRRVKAVETLQHEYKDQEIFKRNYFIRLITILYRYFNIYRGRSPYRKLLWQDDFIYDKVCYFNTNNFLRTAITTSVANAAAENDTKIPSCNIFEEGLFSYNAALEIMFYDRHCKVATLCNLLNMLTGRKGIFSGKTSFTCFYPEIIEHPERYTDDVSLIKLPPLKAEPEFLRILNTAFNYDPSAVSFPQKYIYFATSADYDGLNIGETELVLQLADLVGKDNLLVKMHPRDRRNIYRDNGLTVMENSSTPWEVMQLNHDFSDHVFVSLSSGSIVNIMAMANESIPAYFIYPMVKDKNEWIKKYSGVISSTLEKLQALGVCKSIKTVDNLQDIIK